VDEIDRRCRPLDGRAEGAARYSTGDVASAVGSPDSQLSRTPVVGVPTSCHCPVCSGLLPHLLPDEALENVKRVVWGNKSSTEGPLILKQQ
jgi:hypothetical protein